MEMRLALDTNTYSEFMKGNPTSVAVVQKASAIYLPVPVIAELRFGFLNGTKGKQNERTLNIFLAQDRVVSLSCDEQTCHHYAQIRFQLKRQGTPIPSNNIWIAALVLQYGLVLHTYDTDFNHISSLPRV